MGIIFQQVVDLLILLVVTLFGVCLPLRFHDQENPTHALLLSFGNAFAGGVVLAAGIVHMLSDANKLVLGSLDVIDMLQEEVNFDLVLANSFCLLGILIPFLLEKGGLFVWLVRHDRCRWCFGGHQHQHDALHGTYSRHDHHVDDHTHASLVAKSTTSDGQYGYDHDTLAGQHSSVLITSPHGVEGQALVLTPRTNTINLSCGDIPVLTLSPKRKARHAPLTVVDDLPLEPRERDHLLETPAQVRGTLQHTHCSCITNHDPPSRVRSRSLNTQDLTPGVKCHKCNKWSKCIVPSVAALRLQRRINMLKDAGLDAQIVDHADMIYSSHGAHNANAHEYKHSHSNFASVILALILSLHSVMAGITLGVSKESSSYKFDMLIAMVLHKMFEALAFGVSMSREPINRAAMVRATIYVLCTPVGILIGATMEGYLQLSNFTEGIVVAMTSGSFVYIALVEIVNEEFDDEEYRVFKFLCFIVGAVGMAILGFFV